MKILLIDWLIDRWSLSQGMVDQMRTTKNTLKGTAVNGLDSMLHQWTLSLDIFEVVILLTSWGIIIVLMFIS